MTDTKKILIIGKVWPEPGSSAAGGRMMDLIRLFIKGGYQITFASTAAVSEYSTDLQALGVKVEMVVLNHSSFNHMVKKLDPEIVMFDRFMTEEQFGWRVAEECPGAVRILDTEDLHSLRSARHKALNEGRKFKIEDLCESEIALREFASIWRCDLSLIISEFEYNLLSQQFQMDESQLFHIPFLVDKADLSVTEQAPSFEEREGFVSIGNFLHPPNWNAVLWLKEEIWPLIRKTLPEADLNIYGAYPPPKVFQLHNPREGFRVHGRAESAREVISSSKVLLAPLRFGAGLKGKLLDAMRFGTPSVTSTVGAEGMEDEGHWSGAVTDQPGKFAAEAVDLYNCRSRWIEARKRGKEIISSKFLSSNYEQPLLNRLEELTGNLKKVRRKNFIGSMLMHHTQSSTKYLSKWIEEKNR